MQHAGKVIVAAVLCLTAGGGCRDALFGPSSEQFIAEEAASAWVRRHPVEWTSAVTSVSSATRPEWTPSCTSPLSNGFVSLRLTTDGWDMELAFRCPVDERATPEILQQQFFLAVPSRLPVGVNVPYWRFEGWLPYNAIYDDVTFHSSGDESLVVDIRSHMLGIRGESARRGCANAPDSGDLNSTCLITRSNAVPMRLRLTFPSDLSALR